MYKYIGIRGHRGAGKNSIAYLLGTAIEYFLETECWEGFLASYKKAVKILIEDGACDLNDMKNGQYFKHVIFDSFSDTAKTTLSQIIGIPASWMYDDWIKDATIIDFNSFNFKRASDKIDLQMMISSRKNSMFDAEQLYELVKSGENIEGREIFLTLREMISYYSKYVMQKNLGKNVWVKSLEQESSDQERFFSGNKTVYRIFCDCKFPTEISYIYKKSGKIVKVNRNNNIKQDTNISDQLLNDPRYDFELNLNGNLLDENTFNDIKTIAFNIINSENKND